MHEICIYLLFIFGSAWFDIADANMFFTSNKLGYEKLV